MQLLSIEQLKTVAGGEGTPLDNPHCTVAVLNYLKYRNDLFDDLLMHDVAAQTESSKQMRHYQAIANESCSFEDMRNSGAVGIEIFLI